MRLIDADKIPFHSETEVYGFSDDSVCDIAFKKDIDSLPEVNANPQWISVKNQLPKDGSSCLIYSESGGVSEGHYRPQDGTWTQYRWSCKVKVTHWMPKPEPPEVKL